MADSMRIAFLSAEAVPFVKAGGLADVAGALPAEIASRGHDVDLILPLYRSVDRERFPLTEIGKGRVLFFGDGDESRFGILEHRANDRLRVLFIDAPHYFDREGLYTDPDTGIAYSDDGDRFLFFSLAVLETLGDQANPIDLIHCNDYHTGMVPSLLERNFRHRKALAETATVYSIHNLAYQGLFPSSLLDRAGIHESESKPGSPFEFWGKLNFMKAGICQADLLSTVSPRYAVEITQSAEQGCGLEGLLAERGDALVGILNGIDPEAWNPADDPLIESAFTSEDPDPGKEVNKIALLAEAGLTYDPEVAVVGIVSRLVSQKGFDLFEPIMRRLMSLPVQLVVLGTGEKAIEALFTEYAKRYKDQVGLFLKYDNRLAHRIEAGSDFFLMPSRYEPCGLNQLYSLRYGSLPLVRATGGLADTVIDLEQDPAHGNGFTFSNYSGEAMLGMIKRALACFSDREAMNAVRKRIMKQDFSWEKAAEAYENLYLAAVALRGGEPEAADARLVKARATSAGKRGRGS